MDSLEKHTRFIKQTATRLGFEYCGITQARRLDNDAERFEQWLNSNMHGTMKYMENHFDLRVNPAMLVPGAKSVITLLKNYFPKKQQEANAVKISKYAFGKDYHDVIRSQMKFFLQLIKDEIGEV